jgi:NADH dehydrogenase (ubiquinone) 1 beta subcomplex subunit 7
MNWLILLQEPLLYENKDYVKEFIFKIFSQNVEIQFLKLFREMSLFSEEDLDKRQIPITLRNECVDYFVFLRRCKRQNYYLPHRCKAEKLLYKECMLDLYF